MSGKPEASRRLSPVGQELKLLAASKDGATEEAIALHCPKLISLVMNAPGSQGRATEGGARLVGRKLDEVLKKSRFEALRRAPGLFELETLNDFAEEALAIPAFCVAAAGELMNRTDDEAFRELLRHFGSWVSYEDLMKVPENKRSTVAPRRLRASLWIGRTSQKSASFDRNRHGYALLEALEEAIKLHVAALATQPEVAGISSTEQPTTRLSDGDGQPPVDPYNARQSSDAVLPTRARVGQMNPQLTEVSQELANVILRKLDEERRSRRLTDPFPLPIQLSNGIESHMDHWENIRGERLNGSPIDLSGDLDDVDDIFRRIPSGRMVVLGHGGAGKSVLTIELAMKLLHRRHASDPVPVIFHLTSWTAEDGPATSSPTRMETWLADQLAAYYPSLKKTKRRQESLALQLVRDGGILPILDGLDEVAESVRAQVIAALNVSLGSDKSFVLTSRPEEYVNAVGDGNTLRRAAIIEIDDLTTDAVATFLPLTARRELNGSENRTKWDPVIDYLRSESIDPHHGFLRDALKTPLMVSLARAIYSDTTADPAELLDKTRFADSAIVVNHLLDEFVSSAYKSTPVKGRRDAKRAARLANTEQVRSWLGFLAVVLYDKDMSDFRWWRLRGGLHATPVAMIGALAACAGLMWLPAALFDQEWLLIVAVGGIWVASGVAYDVSTPVPRSFRGTGSKAEDFGRVLFNLFATALVFILAYYLSGNEVFVVESDRPPESLTTIELVALMLSNPAWLAMGFSMLLVALSTALSGSSKLTEIASPATLLRRDKRVALFTALIHTTAIVGALYVGLQSRPQLHTALVVLAALIAYGAVICHSSGLWLLRTEWHAFLNRLPHHTFDFLTDAHLRGVLRQSGGAYQFRHALLQERLATQFIQKTSPRLARSATFLNARINLAMLHFRMRRYAYVEQELRDVITSSERRLSTRSCSVIARFRLIETLRNDGQIKEALREARQLRQDRYSQSVLRRHFWNHAAWSIYADLLRRGGYVVEAEAEYISLLSMLRRESRMDRVQLFLEDQGLVKQDPRERRVKAAQTEEAERGLLRVREALKA